MMMMMRRQTE